MTFVFPPQVPCLVKFQFLSFHSRCSLLMRLQYSRKSNTSKLTLKHEVNFLYVSGKSIGFCLARMGMLKFLQSDKRAIHSEDKIWSSFHCIPLYTECLMKSLLFDCPSLLPLISSTSVLGVVDKIFLNFKEVRLILSKNWHGVILLKIHFCSYLGINGPKIVQFAFF